MRFAKPLIFAALFSGSLSTALSSANSIQNAGASAAEPAEKSTLPRQVILIIGDGMDDQQITIARNYLVGAVGQLSLDRMPQRGVAQVLTIEDTVEGKPVYVADSANTASSIATGVVTSSGRIATSAGADRDLQTIVELASTAGYRSGIVTTAAVTDATPAAFASHLSLRLCEDPSLMRDIRYKDIPLGNCKADLKANGGMGSIAEQLLVSDLDLILGGGAKHFLPAAEGDNEPLSARAVQMGFTLVNTRAELAAISGRQRLLGLFAQGNLPVKMRGENGRVASAPQPSLLNRLHQYLGGVEMPSPMRCEANPDFAHTPSLKQLTETALQQLSMNNSRGFFLMVESASIDKQSHARNPCGSIGELAQLNAALDSALDFAREHPNTLIVVTADHAQAAQLIPYESIFAKFPIPIYSPGQVAVIETPEGSMMAVNYATNNFQLEEHTGANVPVFSNGATALPAFMQQVEIFHIMRRYLGL